MPYDVYCHSFHYDFTLKESSNRAINKSHKTDKIIHATEFIFSFFMSIYFQSMRMCKHGLTCFGKPVCACTRRCEGSKLILKSSFFCFRSSGSFRVSCHQLWRLESQVSIHAHPAFTWVLQT